VEGAVAVVGKANRSAVVVKRDSDAIEMRFLADLQDAGEKS
jgi:hypothetical protein